MTTTTIIGMDISKYSFELWGVDERGHHTLHKRLHRDKVDSSLLIIPALLLLLSLCSGSQHWARMLKELGHQVLLIPAQHVVAFAKGRRMIATMRPRSPKPPVGRVYARCPLRLSTSKTCR